MQESKELACFKDEKWLFVPHMAPRDDTQPFPSGAVQLLSHLRVLHEGGCKLLLLVRGHLDGPSPASTSTLLSEATYYTSTVYHWIPIYALAVHHQLFTTSHWTTSPVPHSFFGYDRIKRA